MDDYEPDIARLQTAHSLIKTDPGRAISELEMLAKIGSSKAPLYLGWAYQKGDGAPLDQVQAEYWLRMSFVREGALSEYYLGMFYSDVGRYSEANLVFEKGSKRGCVPSTYCLAMNILEGKSESKDVDRARCLLETASSQGHVFAQRALASLYLSGQFGVLKIAFGFWLLAKAVVRGICIAVRNLDDEKLRA